MIQCVLTGILVLMMFTEEDARKIGSEIGVDWQSIDIEQFRRGLEVEMYHGMRWGSESELSSIDPFVMGQIALARLQEVPDYYSGKVNA
jgi:hypothetical protein